MLLILRGCKNLFPNQTCFRTVKRKYAVKRSYYEILNVSPKASQQEIKAAYFRLSLLHHPDRNKKGDLKRFTEITEAYEVLGRYNLRKRYDRGYSLKSGLGAADYEEDFTIHSTGPRSSLTKEQIYQLDQSIKELYSEALQKQQKPDAKEDTATQMGKKSSDDGKIIAFVAVLILIMMIFKEIVPKDVQIDKKTSS